MGYELKVDGLSEMSKMLDQLGEKALGVAAQALYEGAGTMRAEIAKSAAAIKTAPFRYASTSRGETRQPSPEEKAAVEAANVGVAKFDKDADGVDTSVGYKNAGYAQIGGKMRPIPAIVNAINSGTSFMAKQPFIRKAGKAAGEKAVKVMQDKIEESWNTIINNGGK